MSPLYINDHPFGSEEPSGHSAPRASGSKRSERLPKKGRLPSIKITEIMTNKSLIVVIVILAVIVLGIYFILISVSPSNKTSQGGTENGSTAGTTFEIQGMKVEILKEGTGEGAKAGEQVTANYVMSLPDGKEIDSSFQRNAPFSFRLGENKIIKGWELGILGMKVGENRKLTIPPELGYGASGVPPTIPPNSTLVYIVQRVK